MKRIAGEVLSIIIISLLVSCAPNKKILRFANETLPLSDTVSLKEGTVVYALPMTVLTIRVEAEKVTEIPGPYSKYAEELLGIKGVIRNRQERWAITGINVSSHEEADPSEFYVIQSSGRFYTNALQLKREGLILDLNPENELPGMLQFTKKELNINQFVSYDLGSDEYYAVQTDTAFRRVKVDSSFIRIPYLVEKKKALSVDQLAERAARRLMDLRDGRLMILTGEANVFPQDAAAIIEINRLEQEYTELFTGKTFSETRVYTYQFIPLTDNIRETVSLFRFSEIDGPSEANSESGSIVSLLITPELKTKDITILTGNKEASPSSSSDKLFYRIPDVASIKVSMDDRILYMSRKIIYQLGEVVQLPSNLIIGK
jgi:hypothetical protein